MKTTLSLSLFILVFFVNLGCVPGTYIYESINWSPHNPLFTADGKMCNSTGPRHLKVQLQSTAFFICPNTATVLQKSSVGIQPANMYENLWLLYDKTAFDECDASRDPNRKRLLGCNTPGLLNYISVQFALHTAEPDGLKFKGGQSYYFIATSDGTESNLNSTRGGHCNDTVNNIYMKLEVYVCQSTDPNCMSDDVGTLSCPPSNCPDGNDCTQPTSPSTVITGGNVDSNRNTSQPEKQARTGDNDEELKMWKYVAIGTSGLAFIFFVMVVVLAFVHFKCGKRRNDVVSASQQMILRQGSVPSTL